MFKTFFYIPILKIIVACIRLNLHMWIIRYWNNGELKTNINNSINKMLLRVLCYRNDYHFYLQINSSILIYINIEKLYAWMSST